jgi:predicted DNA-binding transcriptional regulator AlpA
MKTPTCDIEPAAETRADDCWNVNDVARHFKLQPNTIYKMCRRGDGPPSFHVGGALRFRPAAVRAWARRRERT